MAAGYNNFRTGNMPRIENGFPMPQGMESIQDPNSGYLSDKFTFNASNLKDSKDLQNKLLADNTAWAGLQKQNVGAQANQNANLSRQNLAMRGGIDSNVWSELQRQSKDQAALGKQDVGMQADQNANSINQGIFGMNDQAAQQNQAMNQQAGLINQGNLLSDIEKKREYDAWALKQGTNRMIGLQSAQAFGG